MHFLAKTWFLWWAFADVIVLLWFHMLISHTRVEDLDRVASEEEAAYIASWKLMRKARPVSFSLLEMEQ